MFPGSRDSSSGVRYWRSGAITGSQFVDDAGHRGVQPGEDRADAMVPRGQWGAAHLVGHDGEQDVVRAEQVTQAAHPHVVLPADALEG